jgi:hypothetical protein
MDDTDMKTVDLARNRNGTLVTLELSEFELTTLVALVEEGRQRLHGNPEVTALHQVMTATADEFCSLLGHLELVAAEE